MSLSSSPVSMDTDSSSLRAFSYNPRFAVLVTALLLALCTLIAYNPAVHGSFIDYDDPSYVTTNPHVLQGLTRGSVVWAFGPREANWYPLTWMSHMVDVELFKLNPTGHHLTNVLLHVINVILVFLLMFSVTGRLWRSAMVGALFALHPLNVESVAWIAERKSVLCTFFLILALWAYVWYTKHPNIRRYLLVILCFALALMAKAMAVTFPFLLLLFDYWPLERTRQSAGAEPSRRPSLSRFAKLVFEKTPLFAMSAACAVITVYAARVDGALSTMQALPLLYRLGNGIYSYLLYILKGLWPARLAPIYYHPGTSLAFWKAAVAGCVLIAITILVWRYRERRYLITGWFWYLGAMVPMIGIVQAGQQGMADRYAYIPFLGLFILVVWLVADFVPKVRVAQLGMAGAGAAVLAMCFYLSYRQAGYWKDTITLFSHAVEATPNNPVAEMVLGTALRDAGRPDLALPHLFKAVRLQPVSAKAHYALANALLSLGHTADAWREYQNALRCPSDNLQQASIHNSLGAILLQSKRLAESRQEFSLAINLNPREQNSFLGRGSIEYATGSLDAARDDYSRAAQISPSPTAFYWLGRIFEDENNSDAASAAYRTALQLAPEMADARNRLDALRLRLTKQP